MSLEKAKANTLLYIAKDDIEKIITIFHLLLTQKKELYDIINKIRRLEYAIQSRFAIPKIADPSFTHDSYIEWIIHYQENLYANLMTQTLPVRSMMYISMLQLSYQYSECYQEMYDRFNYLDSQLSRLIYIENWSETSHHKFMIMCLFKKLDLFKSAIYQKNFDDICKAVHHHDIKGVVIAFTELKKIADANNIYLSYKIRNHYVMLLHNMLLHENKDSNICVLDINTNKEQYNPDIYPLGDILPVDVEPVSFPAKRDMGVIFNEMIQVCTGISLYQTQLFTPICLL